MGWIDDISRGASGGARQTQRRSVLEPILDKQARKSCVIVGASFAGLLAARKLVLEEHLDVTIIDVKDYFEYTPGILRCFVEPEYLESLTCPLPTKNRTFIQGEVTLVRPDAVEVRLATGDAQVVPFDYCLLGVGSLYEAPIRASLAETTVSKRRETWDVAHAEAKAAKSFLIVGGGPVGVELAAELVCTWSAKKVTIVDGGGALCAGLPESAQRYITGMAF
jgi:NADH dehydrogenase FAD-containing subunit